MTSFFQFQADEYLTDAAIGCSVGLCMCHNFELDNLKFLEKECDDK
jgi:hypothetical protein